MTPNSPGPKIVMSDNQGTPKTVSKQEQEVRANRTVDSFSPCEENEISNISNSIKDFTRKIQQLQQTKLQFHQLKIQPVKKLPPLQKKL